MVEKVTKDERMATLMKEAAEKAIEILGNKDDFNKDDLSGKEVKATKPKAEKVPDAKGGDEQADNRTSRDVKKANPYTQGKHPQSLRQEHDEDSRRLASKHHHKWKGVKGEHHPYASFFAAPCDECTSFPAEFVCINCATRVCAAHKNEDATW